MYRNMTERKGPCCWFSGVPDITGGRSQVREKASLVYRLIIRGDICGGLREPTQGSKVLEPPPPIGWICLPPTSNPTGLSGNPCLLDHT